MEMTIESIAENLWITLNIFCYLYAIPYLIRKGWGDAENRTKKVCDVCFRDIKKYNDLKSDLRKEGLI